MKQTTNSPRAFAAAVTVALASILLGAPVDARSLHWRSLDVELRLDREGVLRVSETHAMVFSGAWNGGERTFDLRAGQKLTLDRLERTDPDTGRTVSLQKGDLDQVDRYDWHRPDTVRWRSRLRSDPAFDNTEIVYRLDYRLQGVLESVDGSYRLDHEVAFADRTGPIQSLSYRLVLDPPWSAPAGFRHAETVGPLAPGESHYITADLAYTGAEPPRAALRQLDLARLLPLGAASFAALLVIIGFYRHERKQGRYRAADLPRTLDQDWLETHLLSLRPEEVGALWDNSIGSPEVAALVARWANEGHIRTSTRGGSRWRRPVLELELLTDRSEFSGYEKKLIEKLFFDGRRTDTELIRKHYAGKGFAPASLIRAPIERRLRELPGMGRSIPGPKSAAGCSAILAILGLLALEFKTAGEEVAVRSVVVLAVGIVPLVVGHFLANSYRRRADRLRPLAAWMIAPIVLLGLFLLFTVIAPERWDFFAGVRLGLLGLVATALGLVLATMSIFNFARTRDSKAKVALRRKLATIRRRWAEELRKPSPQLRDEWMPYLLAFGLDRNIDRWFKAFAGDSAAIADFGSTSASSASSAGAGRSAGGLGGSSWTGGGGTFGGAGATAAWSSAAVGLAAGVPSPSSGGSSGGGGGGGGGSSGGGGGGGW